MFALWISNRNLKQRIDILEQGLQGGLVIERAPAAAAEEAQAPPSPAEPEVPFTVGYTRVPEHAREAPPLESGSAAPFARAPAEPEPERETLGGVFERLVAGRLLIWLGGIALVVAAVFLIRYSIEIGLVTPKLRMIAAAIFGFVLLGAGE